MVRGSLNFATRSPRKASSSSVKAGPVSAPGAGSTTALISSPQSSCGMPERATAGHVGDRGVAGQLRFDLGRIDIHPAGDDHVAAPVAEKEVAILVLVADVPDS